MVKCCVPDCPHRSEVTKQLHYYGFPKNKDLCRKWVTAIGRADSCDPDKLWEPSPHSRICSWHFPKGRSAGPLRFSHNSDKVFCLPSAQHRRSRVSSSAVAAGVEAPQHGISHDVEAASSTSSFQSPTSTAEVHGSHKSVKCNVLDNSETLPSTAASPAVISSERPVISAQVEAELYFLKQENTELKEQLRKAKTEFSYNHIKDNDELVTLFTGLPSADVFEAIVAMCNRFDVKYKSGWKVEKFSIIDQIFMTLLILRSNLPFSDVAFRFSCSDTTVYNIFTTWLHVLHEIFFKGFYGEIPSMDKGLANLPDCFTTFAVYRLALDSVEVFVQKTSSMTYRRKTYNNCESRRGFRALIGVSPNGVIVYVSDVYGGATSDKLIIAQCGILQSLQSGDLVLMGDKDYRIEDVCPSTVTSEQSPMLALHYVTRHLIPEEVQFLKRIERARSQLERSANLVKSYAILSCVPHSLRFFVTKIFQVCCVLVNFQNPMSVVQHGCL